MNIKRLASRILLIVLLAVCYVIYLQWQMRPGLREIIRLYDAQENLRVRRFYRYGDYGRFSLHYEPNGQLTNGVCSDFLLRSEMILEGMCQEGKWEGQVLGYDRNRELAMEGTYRDGLKHGEFRYYRKGQVNRLQHFRDGRLDGYQEDYFQDGQVHCSGTYRKHRREGEYRCYFPDGKLKLEDHFRRGLRHGIHRRWDPHGRLIWDMPFKDGWETRDIDTYRVRSVMSGDMILLDNDQRVRLKGIREISQVTEDNKSKPREVLKELLRRGNRYADVRLELSPQSTAGDVWEAYVFIDTGHTLDRLKKKENFRAPEDEYYDFFPVRFSHFINASLLKKGVAKVHGINAEDRYYEILKSQERP
ncbi:MAG: hypothetical protein K8I00_00745 [Candidatus Omnitrophica bacterium]|nr:hypothetical protein [Candidatus Omnitrophota bacterium]